MDSLFLSLLLAMLAGVTIPLGAMVANIERIRPRWLENEFRHTIIAFGGGVLLAAVSLVLVPEGIKTLSIFWVVVCFSLGGMVFFLADRFIASCGGSAAQFMAMLLDFVPEAIALGAALATGKSFGLLLALLIALQNFPEGFNAYREFKTDGKQSAKKVLMVFWLLSLIGPPVSVFGS